VFICGFFFLSPARADDTHYQNQLIGEQALGMGGAFTAIANDPTASFYNPGGLAMTPAASISASLNLYGVEHRIVHGGFASWISGEPASVDLEATAYPTIPTTFGVLRAFGEEFADGSRRHAVAFSMLIPDQTSYSYGGSVGRSGESDLDVLSLSETDRTLWVGPSYAIRVSTDLALGLSAFLTMRTFSRVYSRSMETPTTPPADFPTSEYFEFDRVDTSFDSFDLHFRLGAFYRPLRGLSVGLTLGMPSIHVWGEGSLSNQFGYAWLEPGEGIEPYGDFRLESAGGLPAESFLPAEVRLGIAWTPGPEFLGAVDVSYHLPTFEPYERVHRWEADQDRVFYDELFAVRTSRRGVLNVNAGFEWVIAEAWPIRAGFFTNLSSARAVSPGAPSHERIDILGGTISVGHRFSGFTLNLGFLGSVGWGSAQAANLRAAVEGPAYFERDARYDLFYFFVSGAQQVVTETVEKWMTAEEEPGGEPP
jgi:long-chain fatty acid transport protein